MVELNGPSAAHTLDTTGSGVDGGRARLFIGVYPPIDLSRRWLALAREMAPRDSRMTPAPMVHVTVLFLGDVEAARVETVHAILQDVGAAHAPFTLRCDRIETMPSTRPRLLAAMLDDTSPLEELHDDLRASMETLLATQDSGRLTPHATLCRFRRGTRVRPLRASINSSVFEVSQVHLMRSHLAPSGAAHEIAAVMDLGATGR